MKTFALLVAILSLALMLPQSWRQTSSATETITLLTPGSLENGHSEGLVLALPGVASGAPQIPDVGYLARHYPALKNLRILGDGLRAGELERLPENVRVIFEPGAAEGLQAIHWSDAIQLGSPLVVEGAGNLSQVELRNPAGISQSATVRGQHFRMVDLPPARGRFEYELVVTDKLGGKKSSKLGVEVRPARPLSVLMLESAPRFETRELKRWLGEMGYPVTLRTRIGKEVFRREELNGAAQTLQNADIVIADSATLLAQTPAERKALADAVQNGGIGLLVLPDSALPQLQAADAGLYSFKWKVGEQNTELHDTQVTWPGRESPLTGAVTAFPAELELSQAERSLALDPQGRVLVATRRVGQGIVALSLVVASGRWVQAAEPELFAEYWSHLLSALAPAPRTGGEWRRTESGPALVDWPMELELRTKVGEPRASWQDGSGKSFRLALKQDLFDSRKWTATCWPRAAGWITVRAEGSAEASFYISRQSDWQDVEKVRSRRDTLLRAEAAAVSVSQPDWRWWDAGAPLLFLVSAGYLWIAGRKLRAAGASTRAASSNQRV